jgi:hypothetical protein
MNRRGDEKSQASVKRNGRVQDHAGSLKKIMVV